LQDRDDLWRLLVVITARKAIDQVHHQRRHKRGDGAVQGESAWGDPSEAAGIEQVVGSEPTPEFAVQVAEQCQRLLERLGDDSLRAVALRKMEGYTNAEIADEFRCGLRTVERKLRVIRSLWAGEGAA
jgi:DNA-directed RNA polymerase specialized sigma24 family protein